MKNLTTFILILFSFISLGCTAMQDDLINNQEQEQVQNNITQSTFLQGAWIATIYGLNYPSSQTTNSTQLANDLSEIVSYAHNNNITDLFFQVVPSSDCFYNSNILPWSKYLTGSIGTAPTNNFDPLQYIINLCKIYNIKLHAWINPLRVTTSAYDTLPSTHPLYNSNLTFNVSNKTYLNPGIPQSIEHILCIVEEIVTSYQVDGIHFDDYFYPEGDIPDNATYLTYNTEFDNINDWRINNINTLIYKTNELIKSYSNDIAFGVSPPGIWANQSNNSLGSNTSGWQSLYEIYADSYGWIQNNYVDYIAPQLYWYIGQPGSDFEILIKWWNELCTKNNTLLYTGLAGYKQDEITYGTNWLNSNELINQIELCHLYSNGFVIYNFDDMYKSSIINALSN